MTVDELENLLCDYDENLPVYFTFWCEGTEYFVLVEKVQRVGDRVVLSDNPTGD